MSQAELLYPDRLPVPEQTLLAWTLLQDDAVPAHERAHAKCFLTYRAFEGVVSMDDWCSKVHPLQFEIADIELRSRWLTSQMTAEFYLDMKHMQVALDPWHELTESEISGMISIHPAFALNWLRVRTVLAYEALVRGCLEAAMVVETMRFALRHFHAVPFATTPLRVFEMRDDVRALGVLTMIGQAHGCIQACKAPWLTPEIVMREDGHTPWVQCLMLLAKRHGHALFQPSKPCSCGPGDHMDILNQCPHS